MMNVMSSTPSTTGSAFSGTHTHLSGTFNGFLEPLEAHDFLKGSTILHLELYFIDIVPWGHTREARHDPLDPP
jgi:hypothetical protein